MLACCVVGQAEDGGEYKEAPDGLTNLQKTTGATGDGSVDIWGRPADKATTGGWRAATFICGKCIDSTLNCHLPQQTFFYRMSIVVGRNQLPPPDVTFSSVGRIDRAGHPSMRTHILLCPKICNCITLCLYLFSSCNQRFLNTCHGFLSFLSFLRNPV